MINSVFPIRDRVYFLKKGHDYEEYRYTEWGNAFSGTHTYRTISIHNAYDHVIPHLLRSMTLPYEKDVWNHAPKSIRQALLFSYAYHERERNKKVANVEISDWITIPYFARLLTEGKKKTAVIRIFPHFRTWFNAMTQIYGNHRKNLRMGHIHLTYDILNGKDVFCIHWDIGASRFSPSLLLHWLFDDMSS